jgi:predicted O-methyltransferase YrrM
MLKAAIKNALHRLPHIRSLHQQAARQGLFPAGHYHSPVPSPEDLQRRPLNADLLDIELNTDEQFRLLQEFSDFYSDMPFPDTQSETCRYHFDQHWFCHADAIFLYSFLRREQPRRIIEIGSGFSSAVMLDTIERFLPFRPLITFIEPNPDRLHNILKPEDRSHTRILTQHVQDIATDELTSLESGDLLFIDSSHVVKYGSDLVVLMFEVLPRLKAGVFVHFHDVFYPFEYIREWLAQGTYWNEAYFLRAFLAYNSAWKIHFFGNYAGNRFADFIGTHMPLCLKNPGGSLYIRRV